MPESWTLEHGREPRISLLLGITTPDSHTITLLLQGARAGEISASEALLPIVYAELGNLARALFSNERRNHTLQPTALIHEAWVKLAGHIDGMENRGHFFALASQAMRQVLNDHARRRSRQKRAAGREQVTLAGPLAAKHSEGIDLVDFDDSLTRLAKLNERHARVVELRILGGLTIAETAEVLGVSHFTVEGDWFTAKSWLRTELRRA